MSRRYEHLEPHIPHLRRYARALVRDPEGSDDLVQDCLVRAMSRWHLWRPIGSRRAWLFTILHNLHINAVTRTARQGRHVAFDDEAAGSAPARQDQQLHLSEVAEAIGRLPTEQKQVLLLVGLEEFSYAEAARIAGIPIGTVMSRLARGREKLRQLTSDPAGGNTREQTGTPILRRVK